MMKVLIVDDEEWIRLGLREQIDWNSLDLGIAAEAQNGAVAMELLKKEKIDIIITDIRMPVMDGIGLMEHINREFPDIIIIVISGYSEFEYARKAITFSVFDYILKPIEEEKLTETLKKAIERIREVKNKKENLVNLKVKLNEGSVLMREKILTNLVLASGVNFSEIKGSIEKIGVSFEWPRLAVLVFKAANFDSITLKRYKNDIGLAGFVLSNVIGEFVSDRHDSVLFRNYTKLNELILIKGFNTDEYRIIIEDIYDVCNRIIESVREFTEFELYIGIGGEFINIEDACKSYNQALEAVSTTGMVNGSRITHFDEISSRNEYFIFPDDKGTALLYYLDNGYKLQAIHLIEELFDKMSGSMDLSLLSIRNAVLELMLNVNKLLKKYNFFLEELLHTPNIADKIINEMFTISELKEWLKSAIIEVADFLIEKKKTGSKSTIAEIVDYLGTHYCENINLNSVAEKFHINPAYLSRIFKNSIGQNFNDYLNKVRINAALKLLRDGNLKMEDVSLMAGYENVNYFFKRFKKCIGCTPTEYKKSIK